MIVVHVAGQPEGVVQKCSQCGEILVDYTGAVVVSGTNALPCYLTGRMVAVSAGGQQYAVVGRLAIYEQFCGKVVVN